MEGKTMLEEQPIPMPDNNEWQRRKKILEKNFVEKICPNYDLDPEKALYAIQEGILILEPAWIDWEDDNYPEGTHYFVEGFDITCLHYDSEKIKLPKLSWWKRIAQAIERKANKNG